MKTLIICLMPLHLILLSAPTGGDENTFRESQTIGSLSNISGALADFDNDGDLDIYLSNYVGPSQVWFNDGQGFFSPGESFGLSLTNTITVADFDGDLFLDVFLPSNGIPTSLWFNDGSGGFTMSQQVMEHSPGEVAAGDFDSDGDMDLFLGKKEPIEDSVAFNDGSGFLLFPNGRTTSSAYPLAIGDLDSDGDLDAFISRGGLNSPLGNLVLLNDGDGLFQVQNPDGLGDSFGTDVALGDFDKDGDLDAFVTNIAFNGSSPADMVWLNDGHGNFAVSGQLLGNDDAYSVAIADVEPDGDIDVLVTSIDDKQRLWLNNGKGVFSGPVIISQFADASEGLLGDIDGDGDVDAVIITFANTRVLKNNRPHLKPGNVGSFQRPKRVWPRRN